MEGKTNILFMSFSFLFLSQTFAASHRIFSAKKHQICCPRGKRQKWKQRDVHLHARNTRYQYYLDRPWALLRRVHRQSLWVSSTSCMSPKWLNVSILFSTQPEQSLVKLHMKVKLRGTSLWKCSFLWIILCVCPPNYKTFGSNVGDKWMALNI